MSSRFAVRRAQPDPHGALSFRDAEKAMRPDLYKNLASTTVTNLATVLGAIGGAMLGNPIVGVAVAAAFTTALAPLTSHAVNIATSRRSETTSSQTASSGSGGPASQHHNGPSVAELRNLVLAATSHIEQDLATLREIPTAADFILDVLDAPEQTNPELIKFIQAVNTILEKVSDASGDIAAAAHEATEWAKGL